MSDWCNDCAWPIECAARRACHRRDLGEVRAAALPEEAAAIEVEIHGRAVPSSGQYRFPGVSLSGVILVEGDPVRIPRQSSGGRA